MTTSESSHDGRLRMAVTGGTARSATPLESRSAILVRQLTYLVAIEEQALAQTRRARKVVGDNCLARTFADHEVETEEQQRRLCERLEAHGPGGPSTQPTAGKGGGVGKALFAESRPDTPGALAAHAFSYEHLEIAGYALLSFAAEAAGDAATAAMARQIGTEKERMAERLASCFDEAAEASRNGDGAAGRDRRLDRCLADAHAIERQGLQLLETAPKVTDDDDELERLLRQHLAESEEHEQMLRERLEARGAGPAKNEDALLRISGRQVGASFLAEPDTAARMTGFCFAFEHLEIAAYELLERLAKSAGDEKVAGVAARIVAEERAQAARLARRWDRADGSR